MELICCLYFQLPNFSNISIRFWAEVASLRLTPHRKSVTVILAEHLFSKWILWLAWTILLCLIKEMERDDLPAAVACMLYSTGLL